MEQGYKSLIVWQKAVALAREVYNVSKKFPPIEQYALGNQMRRAAVPIPSNIAEGNKCGTKKDYVQFLRIAHGSLAELETQLVIVEDLYPNIDIAQAQGLSDEVSRMLSTIIKKLHV